MPLAAVTFVPLIVCALFAAATYEQWRRMGRADHAASWLWAFVVAGAGWLAMVLEQLLQRTAIVPGAALSLCWFAATLLAVRGLRQRGRRADRGPVLLSIWVGTSIGVNMLQDLAIPDRPARAAATLVVVAGGALLAAIATGPRHRRAAFGVWLSAGLNGIFAALCLAVALFAMSEPTLDTAEMISVLLVPLLVLCGVTSMVCLNEDRAQGLERLARTDALTGVWNRRGFEEGAHHLLDRARAHDGAIAAVAIADIDAFKGINDRHGHAVGDATLVRFAETLRGVTEPGDMLARLGGEEFAILAIGVDGLALHQRMELVRTLLTLPTIDRNVGPPITASFGVATLDPHHFTLREALERADKALYRAKGDGRNRVLLAE